MLKPIGGAALAAFTLSAGVALAAGADAPTTSVGQEEQKVYETVLDSWLGSEAGSQLVNERLSPRPRATDRSNAECIAGASFRDGPAGAPGEETLAGVTFARPGLRLIDGQRWKPSDPEDHLSNRNVEAVVNEAFAHSLITLSQVAFSTDGRDALVAMGMVCGRLCGNGATLRLHKTGDVWKVVRRCNGWIS